jgi:hypothetical protein
MAVGVCSTHAAPVLPTGKSLRTRCTGSRVEFRAGLETVKTKSLDPTGVLSPDNRTCIERDSIVTILFRPTYGV